MFETEDMLPRLAPKPSSANPMGGSELIVRPQVPEVSILFGQQGGNLQTQPQSGGGHQQPPQQTASYAAWKKQMLPKVTFPPVLTQDIPTSRDPMNNNNHMQELNDPRTNLYPLRSTPAPGSIVPISVNGNSNGFISNSSPFASSANGGNQNGYGNNEIGVPNPSSYRRSLENCGNYQPSQQQQCVYRKSVEITTPPSVQSFGSRDVLTICAGTQTDAITSPSSGIQNIPSDLASKRDVEELKQIVQDIKLDQLRLMQMMERFLGSQQLRTNVEYKDAAVQVENEESVPIANLYRPDLGQTPLTAPTNKFIQHLKQSPNVLQTPKGKPMAQSTTYRPNSPQSNRLQDYQQVVSPSSVVPNPPTTNYQQWSNQVAVVLPKPSTDKSLVMNELALKYLPNEKLAELLKDLNIVCPLPPLQKQTMDPSTNCPPSPQNNIDNFERRPSDISNASYKYLKKYRLLPEDHGEDGENENPQHNYGPIRSSPVQQRQIPAAFTPQKPNSPYQQQPIGRLPLSPLARSDTTPAQKNMLDLENIKHQPKFL